MTNQQGVYTYLDISTGHISRDTMDFLESIAGTNAIHQTVAEYEYGCFVSVPDEPDYHEDVPADLRQVLDFARAKGCFIVRFDADGEHYADLPSFNW